MDTSTSIAANGFANGIVALTACEIEFVSGAKASTTTNTNKSIWEKLTDWITSWGSGSSQAPTQTQVIPAPVPSDYIPVMEACIAAGGKFNFNYSSGGG